MRRMRKVVSLLLAVALTITMCDFCGMAGMSLTAEAAEVSGIGNANLSFENDLTGWDTKGTVTVKTDNPRHEKKYVRLEANASITITIKDIAQGSYTLSAWVKGTAGSKGNITVTETGGPDSVALIDTWKKGDSEWNMMGHRNVLVYNGQMKITISAGSQALDLDCVQLRADSTDENSIANWNFENGLASWTKSGTAEEDTSHADTGAKAVRLAADSEISQRVTVEPNTKYSLTMRAKVDKQDEFKTIKVTSSYRKNSDGSPAIMGELQERTSLGDRINLGVRTLDGKVLRQAPAGTTGYSLVTLTFTTGENDTSVEIYANTKYDNNYKDSVTIYKAREVGGEVKTELADDWTGNGSDNAYVDNFDLFKIMDSNYLKGADVSFLPAIEDLGGKYFANGVQQDCLRILSNHGVNAITNMIFVKAGEPAHYSDTLKTVYINTYWKDGYWFKEDGSPAELKMIQGGFFDKVHSLELGKRATELGMGYLPSFHYSDTWMSAAKAFSPVEWLDEDYKTGYKNIDIERLQAMVYHYVYDFAKTLADNNVNVCGVKHGNEQDGGVAWPNGAGIASVGHAKVIAASYNAVEDALPGVAGYVHTNSGYEEKKFSTMYTPLKNNGAKIDGAAFSLYGGRSSGNIVKIANFMAKDANLRYMDYINVETGFSFTRYKATVDSQSNGGSMYQAAYYSGTPNGQYNWLLDYQQSGLDTPNPYGQTRGFFYWETDWIPTPGAGSTDGGSADVNQRIMFNNGDTGIKEMGSAQPGKAGDMMDSMYAYLLRGCAKRKDPRIHTESSGSDYGDYTVDLADPTGISFTKTSVAVTEGEKVRLEPIITPTDKVLTDSHITYTSARPDIARVTKDGFVCGVTGGKKTTITASVKGNHTATIEVTVFAAKKATGITLKMDNAVVENKSSKTANIFDKLQLTASLAGSPTNATVVYTSSNPDVAYFLGQTWQTPKGQMRQETEKTDTRVQLNVVNGGTTTITAASADGGASVSFTLTASKVAAQKVTVAPAEVSIVQKQSAQLSATVAPTNTSRYKIRWESSDENIAKVDQNGKVTAVGIGEAVIKAVSDDNKDVYGSCKVHATGVRAQSVEIDKKNLTIQVGSTKKLNALVSPSNTYNKKVTWSSGNSNIATVNEDGEVTGVAIGGPVTITATTEDGGFKATSQVTVQKDAILVTGITISEKEYYFSSDYFSDANSGQTAPVHRLTANVQPESATDTDIIWSSETPEIATVDQYGNVTAVNGGVTVITATTADGGLTAHTKVYVPSVSESFDNREDGDTWGMKIASGFTNTGATLNSSVTAEGSGKILQLSGGGSGARGLQKKFSKTISNNKIILDFDWNVSTAKYSNGAYLTITDSNNNRYLSIQTGWSTELVFSTGGQPKDVEALSNATAVGTGFNKDDTWYRLHVVLDMRAKKVAFTITSLADSKLKASHEVAFDAATRYMGDVAAIQFVATRNGGSMSWSPALDNLNIYKTEAGVSGIKLNKDKVKLIPVKGTLGEKCQLEASVFPSSESQEVKWESSDTSLVKVDANGLVTSATTYDSLADIKTGNCTIKVSSVQEPSVYMEIPVTVTSTPNASEFFSILNEEGEEVFPSEDVINLNAGERKIFTPKLTGGDGDSDVAGLKWESSDSNVVSVDKDSGIVTAVGEGTATVTLTVTMYAGQPLTGEINFNVTGEAIGIDDSISAISINDITGRIWRNREVRLTAAVEPQNAKEKVFWSSSDTSVAVVDKNSGMLYPVGSGKATITAAGEYGRVKASKEISVVEVSDLSSYFDQTGVKITATNTKTGREINHAFDNARNNDWSGGTGGTNAWSTGSSEVGIITIDLGAKAKIDNVKTVFYSKMKYTLDVSDDGQNWTTKVDHSGQAAGVLNDTATAPFTDTFPADTTARYVRLNIIENTGGGWTGMTYMQVNGEILPEKTFADKITCQPAQIAASGDVTAENLPETVSAALSSGESVNLPVVWDEAALESIKAGRPGVYAVTGTVTVDGVAYAVVCNATVEKDLTNAVVTLTPNSYVYDGEEKTPAVTVQLNGKTVSQDAYTVEYKNNVNVGTATVEVTGQNGYTGKAVGAFTIRDAFVAADLADAVVTLTPNSYVYDGEEKTPAVTVKLNGKTVPENGYTVEYRNNINVGTATVVVTGQNEYTGTVEGTFTIREAPVAADLTDAVVTLTPNSYVYDGEEKTPAVTVKLNGKVVPENGYTVEYKNNINVGTATAEVTGQNGYTGTAEGTFTIREAPVAADLKDAVVTLTPNSYVYDGEAKTPAVTVKLNGKVVPENGYTVEYKNNINVGTATAEVTGQNGYTGTAEGTFTITEPPAAADLKDAVVTLTPDSFVYDGEEKTPAVTVQLNGEIVPENGYTVKYKNNINVGTATAEVTGQNGYTGKAEGTFTIEEPPVAADLTGAVVTLTPDSFVYDGEEKTPAVTIQLDGKTVPENGYTVRYKYNINVGTATVEITGQNGYTGKIVKTFIITEASAVSLKDAVVTLEPDSYVYDGEEKTPAVTVKLGGETVLQDAYTVEYKDNIDAGTATVKITGQNGYYEGTETTFTIAKAPAVITLKKPSLKVAYGSKNFALGASVNSEGKLTYKPNNKTVIKIVGNKAKIIGCGKVTVNVKAAETSNYEAASKKLNISIVPKKVALKSVSSKKAGQVTVNWKKDNKASGYTIMLSLNKKFKGVKKVNVKSYKTTSSTISGLKKGKTYYVKICAYKTVKKKPIDGFASTVKKVKIKK